MPNLSTKIISSVRKKKKSKNHDQISNILSTSSNKFKPPQTTLIQYIFLKKSNLVIVKEKVYITIEFFILKLISVPTYSLKTISFCYTKCVQKVYLQLQT